MPIHVRDLSIPGIKAQSQTHAYELCAGNNPNGPSSKELQDFQRKAKCGLIKKSLISDDLEPREI